MNQTELSLSFIQVERMVINRYTVMFNQHAFKGLKSERSLFLGSLEPNQYMFKRSSGLLGLLSFPYFKEIITHG